MALLVSALAVTARASADDAAECTTDALLLSHFGRAFDACYRLAEEGSPLAQYNLGELYNRGLGVPRDYSEGSVWLRTRDSLRHRRPWVICSSRVKACPLTTLRPPSGTAGLPSRDMQKHSTSLGCIMPKVGEFLGTMYWHICG